MVSFTYQCFEMWHFYWTAWHHQKQQDRHDKSDSVQQEMKRTLCCRDHPCSCQSWLCSPALSFLHHPLESIYRSVGWKYSSQRHVTETKLKERSRSVNDLCIMPNVLLLLSTVQLLASAQHSHHIQVELTLPQGFLVLHNTSKLLRLSYVFVTLDIYLVVLLQKRFLDPPASHSW